MKSQSAKRTISLRFSPQVPTLVSSIEDCLYNTYPGACYTAENIPGARFLVYPTGGHLAVGHETELWSEVRQFLHAAA